MTTRQDIKAVFDHWNIYKGKGKWRSHREMTYDIECAVKDTLKHYTIKQICQAIDNYALVLLGKEYRWSYAWPLALFLTRHRPDDRKILQFTRFLGNGTFAREDYMTPEAVKERIAEHRTRTTFIEAPVKIITGEEKAEMRKKLPLSIQKRMDMKEKD
jgi:hypothetical protein